MVAGRGRKHAVDQAAETGLDVGAAGERHVAAGGEGAGDQAHARSRPDLLGQIVFRAAQIGLQGEGGGLAGGA